MGFRVENEYGKFRKLVVERGIKNELVSYKYIMLTDDKNAVRLLGQVKQNVARNLAQRYLTAHTSANLCWQMIKCGRCPVKKWQIKLCGKK